MNPSQLCEHCRAASSTTAFWEMLDDTPRLALLCADCALVAQRRSSDTLLGPRFWARNWSELEEWLRREIEHALTLNQLRLLACEVRRLAPDLSGSPPASVSAFLRAHHES